MTVPDDEDERNRLLALPHQHLPGRRAHRPQPGREPFQLVGQAVGEASIPARPSARAAAQGGICTQHRLQAAVGQFEPGTGKVWLK